MIERLKAALAAENIDIYSISETDKESREAFFVKKELDLARSTSLRDYTVTVYRETQTEAGRRLGSSTLPVYESMTEEELREALRAGAFAASLAGNQYYELAAGRREEFKPAQYRPGEGGLEGDLDAMVKALFAPDRGGEAFVNSAEFFVTLSHRRVVNSRGVDVSWEVYDISGEYVIQCLEPRDVETHHTFSYSRPDTKALIEDVEESLRVTRDRAQAQRAPKAGKYTLILSGPQVRELLSFYLGRSGAAMVYQGFSDFAPGDDIQGGDVSGERLTLELAATEPYDGEGIPLRDRTLIEDGVLKTLHGGARFSYYMGVEPTGSYKCLRVPAGRKSLEEMKSAPHLHVVAFSDFQMDTFSGHFGGEIRLGYLFDGERTVPVTGGSVNGSILEAQKGMEFSKELYRSAEYEGPLAVSLPDVAVAGE